MSNKVSIIRDGNEFPLTNEEIENVYRFQTFPANHTDGCVYLKET